MFMVLFKLVERSLGFISTLILVRLLVPADFGLVAMATSFIVLIELFGAFGFDTSLIRLERAERAHFDTAWTLNVAAGCALGLLMVAGAIPLSQFYHESRLPAVMIVLAMGSVATSLENVGVVEFRRTLQFGLEFRFQVAKKLASFVIAVPLAFILRNHWALVAGMLASRIVSTGWSYIVHPYRPRFALGGVRELFGFSKWIFLNNLLLFLRDRSSDFIIGRLAGSAALGLYNLGSEVASLPTTELAAPINRAAFPGYAKVARDLVVLRKSFLDVIGVVALLSVPAGIGIAAVAPLACEVLLGPKWLDSVPIIEIVAICGAILAIQSNGFSVYLAIGRADLTTRITAGYVLMLLPLSVVLTTKLGAKGAAIAYLITTVLFAPINYGVLLSKLQLSAVRFLAVVCRPVIASAVMFGGARLASDLLSQRLLPVFALLVAVVVGVCVYVASVLAMWLLAGKPQGAESAVIGKAIDWVGIRRIAADP